MSRGRMYAAVRTKEMAVEDEVLKDIESGKFRMRPKAYFSIRRTMGILMGFIVLLLLVYLASFMVFSLRESGVWYEPEFGVAGWTAFFSSLPWILIALIAILFAALSAIMNRSTASYRWPVLYSLAGAICLIAVADLFIMDTSLRGAIFVNGAREKVPIVGDYYGDFTVPVERDVHRGQIGAALPGGGFVLMDLYGATSAVLVASETSFLPPLVSSSIFPGEEVVVFGDRNVSDTIDAIGIGKLSP